MKYEILLLSILIVASYSSACTDQKPQSSYDCEGLSTTADSGTTCCGIQVYSLDYTQLKVTCFEHKLTQPQSKDLPGLDKIANTFLKNTTNAGSVQYKCSIGEEGAEDRYEVENYIDFCSITENPSSGDTCAEAFDETVTNKTGLHCCLLDYEFSAIPEGSGSFTSAAGKMCISIDDKSYNNITHLLEDEGINGDDDDRRRRHLSDDDDIKIKRYNVNCGTGKPAGQSNGQTISGVTNEAKSGTTGITGTSDAKLVKTGVMILILSLLI